MSDQTTTSGIVLADRTYATIWAKDYGGYAVVTAEVTLTNGSSFTLFPLKIPRSSETSSNDRISDKWESDRVKEWNQQYGEEQAVGNEFFSSAGDEEKLDPDGAGASNAYVDQASSGDILSTFEEYRGFILDGGGGGATGQMSHAGGHKRLSPARKEALLEVDHEATLGNLPPGGVKAYFNGGARPA